MKDPRHTRQWILKFLECAKHLSDEDACREAGITPQIYKNWRSRYSRRREAPKKRKHHVTYTTENFAQIAFAVGKGWTSADIANYAPLFEEAADWYLRGLAEPDRPNPSATRKSMKQIAGAARKLLRHLGVQKLTDAPDGPPDSAILEALAEASGGSPDLVVRATGRLGRFIELLEGVEATRDFHTWATQAAAADEGGRFMVPPGHHGDLLVRVWIGWMQDLYKSVTGRTPSPGTSENLEGGPFVRFLRAAGMPLGIHKSTPAWRSLVQAADRAK